MAEQEKEPPRAPNGAPTSAQSSEAGVGPQPEPTREAVAGSQTDRAPARPLHDGRTEGDATQQATSAETTAAPLDASHDAGAAPPPEAMQQASPPSDDPLKPQRPRAAARLARLKGKVAPAQPRPRPQEDVDAAFEAAEPISEGADFSLDAPDRVGDSSARPPSTPPLRQTTPSRNAERQRRADHQRGAERAPSAELSQTAEPAQSATAVESATAVQSAERLQGAEPLKSDDVDQSAERPKGAAPSQGGTRQRLAQRLANVKAAVALPRPPTQRIDEAGSPPRGAPQGGDGANGGRVAPLPADRAPAPTQARAANTPALVAPRPPISSGLRAEIARPNTRKKMTSSRAALLSMTSQEAPLEEQHDEPDLLSSIIAVAMRVVGFIWLAASVAIWMRLVGASGLGGPESAALAPSWYDLSAALVPMLVAAIVAPIVSVGLWLVTSWGGVVWGAAVVGTLIAMMAAPGAIPMAGMVFAANLLAMVVIGALVGLRAWRDRDFDD
ncbi:MAG: hypothetical protein AAGJ94_03565 [Pseudomonadota bacterium]